MKTVDGVLYCNDGAWVESCTALVERWAACRLSAGILEQISLRETREATQLQFGRSRAVSVPNSRQASLANRERLLSGRPVRRPDAMLMASSTETPPKRGLIVVVSPSRSLATFRRKNDVVELASQAHAHDIRRGLTTASE